MYTYIGLGMRKPVFGGLRTTRAQTSLPIPAFVNSSLESIIWALMRANLSSEVCEQQRHRPACASTQSDQCLCYSLWETPLLFALRKYQIFTWYERNFNFLASLCGWAGWLEIHLVRNPEDRFCRDGAHINVCYKQNFNLLAASLCSSAWLIQTPKEMFSHIQALCFVTLYIIEKNFKVFSCKQTTRLIGKWF